MELPSEQLTQEAKDALFLTEAQRALGWHVHGWGIGTVIRKDSDAGGVVKWIKPAVGITPFRLPWRYGLNEGASLIRLRLEQDGAVPKAPHILSTEKSIGYSASVAIAIREVERCAAQRRLELIEGGLDLSRLSAGIGEAGKSLNTLLGAGELLKHAEAWETAMLDKIKTEGPRYWTGYDKDQLSRWMDLWGDKPLPIEKKVDDKPYMADEEGIDGSRGDVAV